MKIKNIIRTALVCIMTSFMLSGCFPSGEKNNFQSEQNDPSVLAGNQTYTATFDYQIPANLPTQVPKIKVKPKTLDKELVKNVLLHNKTITEEKINGERVFIRTSDESVLIITNDSFNFIDMSIAADPRDFVNVPVYYIDLNYSSDVELKSFSRQDAVERVNKVLDEIGIDNYGEPYIIPITPEMANYSLETYGSFARDEYTLWTEDDGEYILIYPLNVNGINASTKAMRISGRTLYGEEIVAYVTKDSVFRIDNKALYDVVSADEGTAELKFDAEYASNELKSRYSKILLDYPTFFTECRLEYIPLEQTDDLGIIYAPAWCFSGYQLQGPDKDSPSDYLEYYYAETGVRWGGY